MRKQKKWSRCMNNRVMISRSAYGKGTKRYYSGRRVPSRITRFIRQFQCYAVETVPVERTSRTPFRDRAHFVSIIIISFIVVDCALLIQCANTIRFQFSFPTWFYFSVSALLGTVFVSNERAQTFLFFLLQICTSVNIFWTEVYTSPLEWQTWTEKLDVLEE